MTTELLTPDGTERAGELIRQGKLVVFPTETVYGLGADALDPGACRRIFEAKGRPQDNPLIVHIYDRSQVDLVARALPPGAEILMDSFWPGPLTLVLPKKSAVSDVVTAGLDTVGVRMPRHPAALDFLKAAGTPVAAPSANRSGKPSPTNFAMARSAMEGRAEAIIDGGQCETGLESTVAAWTDTAAGRGWTILRPGAVTREDLYSVLDDLYLSQESARDEDLLARSPGTRHPHYQPRAEVRLFSDAEELERANAAGCYQGWAVLCAEEAKNAAETERGPLLVRSYPGWIALARRLYSDFYELDSAGVPGILAQIPTEEGGISDALRNRLLKASAGRLIEF